MRRPLETIFSISVIISILLFLAKITILPPNYVISVNLGFLGMALATLEFILLFKQIVASKAFFFFFFEIYKNTEFVYFSLVDSRTLSPCGFKGPPHGFKVFI